MQYLNKCKICGTSIIAKTKTSICEACGSEDIKHSKILSVKEKVEQKCINWMLWTFSVMIVVPLIFAIVKICC